MAARRLTRSTTDRKIAGVCGGLAEYIGTDPTLVRILWVLAVVAGGFGFLAYVIMWIACRRGRGRGSTGDIRHADAEERYARGEITADELARIRSDLGSP